jgi:hypothetical protein
MTVLFSENPVMQNINFMLNSHLNRFIIIIIKNPGGVFTSFELVYAYYHRLFFKKAGIGTERSVRTAVDDFIECK